MLEVVREFFDKKSPIFIITISILIATIILLDYEIDPLFASAHQLRLLELSVLVVACLEVLLKTIGMEVLSRLYAAAIGEIHVGVILVFLLANLALYAWSVALSLAFAKEGATALNEPHEFFLQIYCLAFSAVYLAVLGLLVSLKLENQTMTVLEEEQKERSNKFELSS